MESRMVETADEFRKLDPEGVTEYWCYHGISTTYPCPECFLVSIPNAKPRRSTDNKLFYEKSKGEQP